MAYNLLQKLNNNIAAIRIALEWQKGESLSPEQTDTLKNYSGFGGLKAVLYPAAEKEEWVKLNATESDLRLHDKIMELHDLLQQHFNEKQYKEVVDSIKNSVLTAFYTPNVVPKTLYQALKEQDIHPRRIYEPSTGAGIFVTEAIKAFPELQQITAVEKDILSGRVVQALSSTLDVPAKVHITGFEETPVNDNGKCDLIVSNIPFGNFSVYDETFPDKELSGKIHNYFFVKGLDKIDNGGLLAYITTDGFLNNPSNKPAREYLFNRADFISLTVMPDNLMKATGNTEAPSHLLIVQKNTSKEHLSVEEKALIDTLGQENEFGQYHLNKYVHQHPEIIAGDEIKAGKNQYGNANQSVRQHGNIDAITEKLNETITEGLSNRFSKSLYQNAQLSAAFETVTEGKKMTFLPVPENKSETVNVQLGLFDSTPAENINRAMAYINDLDITVIEKQSARIISTVKTTAKPEHESIVLVAAKARSVKQYLYKLYSNVEELNFTVNWSNSAAMAHQLKELSHQLQQYGYDYIYEGDKSLQPAFGLEREAPQLFTDLKSFYKDQSLVIHHGKIGIIREIDTDFKQAKFEALPLNQNHKKFYGRYILLRDSYLELVEIESTQQREYPELRDRLKDNYEQFTANYGQLNRPDNRKQITNDAAFGFIVLSSLERKENENYVRADILKHSLIQKQEQFRTDDPTEALARCLNEHGQVDIDFIEAATGLAPAEVINKLEHHIYLNPQYNKWETVDQYLSGNVVEKLGIAKEQQKLYPDNIHVQKSLEAITKVQPEKFRLNFWIST